MPGSAAAPVLVIGAGASRATVARLDAALPGAPLERIAADAVDGGLGGVMRALCTARRPCVYVGPIEPLVLALASPIAGGDVQDWAPLVAVTPEGETAMALLGGTRGGDVLAGQVARALAAPPMAAGSGEAPTPIGSPAESPASNSVQVSIRSPTRCPARMAPPADPRPGPGRLAVVGLGPGAAELMAPAVREALDRAQDIVGYTTYVRMAGPFRPEQRILDSDNRQEMDRARLAFTLAAQGRRVVVVSSGDPGVFAMAAAVVEALEQAEDPAWQAVELQVLPGISAAQAAAARAGAPLGHDFCCLSLSDNLKPWAQIERRLELAALADLVVALYNPSSKARPWQLQSTLDLLRRHRAPGTPVVLGRDVGRPDERVIATTLGEVRPEQVDMRTVVIVGSSQTRAFARGDGGAWVYTPRWYPPDASERGSATEPCDGTGAEPAAAPCEPPRP